MNSLFTPSDRDSRVYRNLFDHAVEGIFITSVEGRYLLVNNRLAEIYGFEDPHELMLHFEDIGTQLYVEPERRTEFARAMEKHGQVLQFESQVRRKDGAIIWISENARLMQDETSGAPYYEGTVIDITDRKQMERSLERQTILYHQLFDGAPVGIVLLDADRHVRMCNPAFESLFGWRATDILGSHLQSAIIPPDRLTEAENYRALILSGHSATLETERLHRDGTLIPVSVQGFPVVIDNEINGIYFIYQDISERKQNEAIIVHQAFHDALTGLPNRNLFNERLSRALERAKRKPYPFALVLIDLDRFKKVNDTMGHLTGDKLLIEVGKILTSAIRATDTAARLGGDEFALLLEDFHSSDEITGILNRIQDRLHHGIEVNGQRLQSAGSMGIVVYEDTYHAAEDLMRDADIAMYRAKEQQKPYIFFSAEMQRNILEMIEMEAALKAAIENDELELVYQPIVALSSNRLEGFEALLRWQRPGRGLIAPDLFIPVAEDTGMILPIGAWVLKKALQQLKAWSGRADLIMSVNVSIRQFTHGDLVTLVRDALNEANIEPHRLRLEITESTLISDLGQVLQIAHNLRGLGVKLAIDDFGTGYSSLSYLNELPVDCLKIDRSFIQAAAQENKDSYHIIKSVLGMARDLGVTVVAEGVEYESQQDLLRELDCDNAQGYLYSRPLSAEEAGQFFMS
ncbi:MAG: EAL domain-containing protein [Spirochaetales bacterium]|nr:EAL domain-containing protein [Spirochaetales bacterium]